MLSQIERMNELSSFNKSQDRKGKKFYTTPANMGRSQRGGRHAKTQEHNDI